MPCDACGHFGSSGAAFGVHTWPQAAVQLYEWHCSFIFSHPPSLFLGRSNRSCTAVWCLPRVFDPPLCVDLKGGPPVRMSTSSGHSAAAMLQPGSSPVGPHYPSLSRCSRGTRCLH